jgi:hypothetical protein
MKSEGMFMEYPTPPHCPDLIRPGLRAKTLHWLTLRLVSYLRPLVAERGFEDIRTVPTSIMTDVRDVAIRRRRDWLWPLPRQAFRQHRIDPFTTYLQMLDDAARSDETPVVAIFNRAVEHSGWGLATCHTPHWFQVVTASSLHFAICDVYSRNDYAAKPGLWQSRIAGWSDLVDHLDPRLRASCPIPGVDTPA